MLQLKQKQAGFTIIEMIVSLGLFSVVVTIAMGALLMLVAANNNVQGEQAVMTNLSFALDSMTREIRVGTEYYCNSRSDYSAGGSANIFDGNIPTNPTDGNDLDGILGDDTNDCEDGLGNSGHKLQGVAFNEGGDSITQAANKRILYFFDANAKQLYRRVGVGDPVPLVSSDVIIQKAEFFVTGSAPQSDGGGQDDQPVVSIILEAVEQNDPNKIYRMQTSVTQRALDI